jgi:hypothetical protein
VIHSHTHIGNQPLLLFRLISTIRKLSNLGDAVLHRIGGSFVDGVLTVINTCQRPVAVYWGLGNFHSSGEVAFTVPTIVLPAGATRQIMAATFSYTGDISWTACEVGMHVVDTMTGRHVTGIRLGTALGCR